MKKLCFAALLVLLMPVAALAQLRADVFVTTAENSGCGTGNENKLYLIINASNASDCDSTGGGAANALCLCDGGTMKSVASGYAPLAGADFTGPVSVTLGNDDAFVVTGADGATLSVECDEGDCAVGASAFSVADGYFSAAGFNGGAYTQLSASDEYTSIYGNDGAGIESFLQIDSATGVMTLYSDAPLTIKGCTFHGTLSDYSGIATPTECDTFFDLTLHVPCFYNGSAWKSAIDGTTDCTSGS